MRINIPFSGLVMKEVPPGGDHLNGVFIPGGTRIAHNTLALQRSTVTFGDDAALFRPERWLEASPEKHKEMTQIVEMVFGYGRWMCGGKSVAFMELNKAFVQVRCLPGEQAKFLQCPLLTRHRQAASKF